MGRFTFGLDEAAEFFGRKDDLGISLQERDMRIVYAVRIAVNRFFLRSGWFDKSYRRERLEAFECQGRTVAKERHRAKSLMAKNSAERLVASAIWNRENPRFWTPSTRPAHPSLSTTVGYADFKRGCRSMNIRFRKFESSNSRVELALKGSIVLSGRVIL